jgi:23S rRNA pseudouridine1911/1915/1917 synthase
MLGSTLFMTDPESSPTPASQSLTKAIELEIPAANAGERLDSVLAALIPDFSRSRIQAMLKAQLVLLDGAPSARAHRVVGGEQVTAWLAPRETTHWSAQSLALDRVFEDDDVVVVNKPAALVVHPGAGNQHGTLANAILADYPTAANLPRCGIVHRLDKDTTGLMVLAKTELAHRVLIEQLSSRTVKREYLALVRGEPTGGGVVDEPIARHPRDRKRMHVQARGKAAITHYRIEARFKGYTLLRVSLQTGRTHQIRVHMQHIGMPLVADPVYGGRPRPLAGAAPELMATIRGFGRQVLHATRLSFEHPRTGETVENQCAPPSDMADLLRLLKQHNVVD